MFVRVKARPFSNLYVEMLNDRTSDGSHLGHRNILSNADRGPLGERHEGLATRRDMFLRHSVPVRQGICLLQQPAFRPERVWQRRKVLSVAVNRVSPG